MSPTKHVAVVPWPFTSHPFTMVALLVRMANSAPKTRFSFFNTEKCNRVLLSASVLDHLPPNITIYIFEDGVPPNHVFSKNNHLEPYDLFLTSAPQGLKTRIKLTVEDTGCNITCIVTDFYLPFAADIAESFNASWVAVYCSSPCCFATHLYNDIIYQKFGNGSVDGDRSVDFVPYLSPIRVKDLPLAVLTKDSQKSAFAKMLARMGDSLLKAKVVALSSFEELNPEGLNNELNAKFKNFINLGIVPIASDSDPECCLQWLDKQPSKSVVYISFGTVGVLTEKEMQALAEALEHNKIPFIWCLPKNLLGKLPKGFVERTQTLGKIVSWAPQRSVLSHEAVAVFISQAGYNSVKESIVSGVPMICRPIVGDQMISARMVEIFWRIGVVVDDGVITTVGLLDKLRMFLSADDERGKILRDNVEKLKNTLLMSSQPGGSDARDFDKLMHIINNA